ncbi:MAG: molybdopterin-dependent oxidoreductase, partial [Candidatus Dormibacteria bacterium]
PAPSPGKNGAEILDAVATGEIRALLLLGPSAILGDGSGTGGPAAAALRKAQTIVAIDTRPGPATAAAHVVIPGHAHFEKSGSVTNLEGRVQRIRQALPPATSTPLETRVLTMLAAELGARDWGNGDPIMVNRAIGEALPAFRAAGNGGRTRWESEA